MQLSDEEKLKFSTIMFKEGKREVGSLKEEEKSKLKDMYAQKIAYDTVNAHIQPPPDPVPSAGDGSSGSTGFVTTVCCCFYPENYRSVFDITSEVFLKRALRTFMFWKNDFLDLGENNKPQLYGYLWISITYVIVLGLAANLNQYFNVKQNYSFQSQLMLKGLGITAIFQIAEVFTYAGVVRCLKGEMSFVESAMLIGYSLVLYLIPTFLCLIPSLYWHLGMLAIAGLLRGFFLFRNYSTKVQEKSFVLLIVILIVEILYCFVMLKTMFRNYSGKTFAQGSRKVFHHFLSNRQFFN